MDIKAIIIILGTILALYVYKRQRVKQKALLKQAYDARLQEGEVDKGITDFTHIYIDDPTPLKSDELTSQIKRVIQCFGVGNFILSLVSVLIIYAAVMIHAKVSPGLAQNVENFFAAGTFSILVTTGYFDIHQIITLRKFFNKQIDNVAEKYELLKTGAIFVVSFGMFWCMFTYIF